MDVTRPACRWRARFRLQPFEPTEDPDRAPSASCGTGAARPWTLRRALQNRVGVYLFGLVFLIFSFGAFFGPSDRGPGIGVRIAELALICLLYAGASLVADTRLRVRQGYLALFIAVTFLTWSQLGWGVFYFGAYVAVMMACLLPWRHSRLLILVWALAGGVAAVISQDWAVGVVAGLALAFGWATGSAFEAGRLATSLDRTRQRNVVLAVAAERERIARDLHDILGHSLTAIAIKSDLAKRLVDRDAPAAQDQLTEIEQVARQALADVRATASGIREVRVATEIASARSVLLAAGVQANVPTTVPPMPDEVSEVLGFVVREAVTNTVRHADATTVSITAGPNWVEVRDDGRGLDAQLGYGSGLAGLRSRVTALQGTLRVGSGPHGGTVIRADVPTPRLSTPDAGSLRSAPADAGSLGSAPAEATTSGSAALRTRPPRTPSVPV